MYIHLLRKIVCCGRRYTNNPITGLNFHPSKFRKKVKSIWDEELEKYTSKDMREQFIKRYKQITGDPKRNKIDLSRRFLCEIHSCLEVQNPRLYLKKPIILKSICPRNSLQGYESDIGAKNSKRRHGSVLPGRNNIQILKSSKDEYELSEIDDKIYNEFQSIINDKAFLMRRKTRVRRLNSYHKDIFKTMYNKSVDGQRRSLEILKH